MLSLSYVEVALLVRRSSSSWSLGPYSRVSAEPPVICKMQTELSLAVLEMAPGTASEDASKPGVTWQSVNQATAQD